MVATIVLVGTGTEVGKTHVAERLLRALATLGLRAYGYKPVESGVAPGQEERSDARRLELASCHVKHVPLRYVFEEPVSPHIAARRDGVVIDTSALIAEAERLARLVDALVVELPGGAFSPISDAWLAIDAARAIRGARLLLVAADRLGVLHDVGAATRACALAGAPLHGLVLNAPQTRDKSTGTNAAELGRVTSTPLLAAIERAPADAPLGEGDPALELARRLIR